MEGGAAPRINPPHRRARPTPTPPASPPAVLATFAVSFDVQQAHGLFEEAKKQLMREGCEDGDVADLLCTNGHVDIGECLCALLRPVVARIAKTTKCKVVADEEVYIEPIATETSDD